MFSLLFKILAFLFRGLDLIVPAYGTVFAAILLRPYYDIFAFLPKEFVVQEIAATDTAIHCCAGVIFAALLILQTLKKSIKFMQKYKIVNRASLRPQRIVVESDKE
jgi:hypothetical protein